MARRGAGPRGPAAGDNPARTAIRQQAGEQLGRHRVPPPVERVEGRLV